MLSERTFDVKLGSASLGQAALEFGRALLELAVPLLDLFYLAVKLLGAALRRAARVEDQHIAVPRQLGHVRVAVDDGVAPFEARGESIRPARGRPRDVH